MMYRPFARIAQVITLPSRPMPIVEVKRPGLVIEVPFVRLGLRTRSAEKRSTSKEILAVHAQETRRGVRRCVL
jgi:hypothetical protein